MCMLCKQIERWDCEWELSDLQEKNNANKNNERKANKYKNAGEINESAHST